MMFKKILLMTFGYCHLSIIPLREEPSDTSQMVSQLLFGDVFEILEKVSDNWIHIRNAYDSYEGYIDPKQQMAIDSIDFISLKEPNMVNRETMRIITKQGEIIIPPACSFKNITDEEDSFVISASDSIYPFQTCGRDEITETAESFLNAPYLWGGKTPFGIDCSGFTQSVYKISGLKLKRDAAQQANQGETLNFMEEALPGDLAFFDNEEGNIIHVGIILSDERIIHASGKIRIDKIDHHGIYNKDLGKYTHQLRLVKRVL